MGATVSSAGCELFVELTDCIGAVLLFDGSRSGVLTLEDNIYKAAMTTRSITTKAATIGPTFLWLPFGLAVPLYWFIGAIFSGGKFETG